MKAGDLNRQIVIQSRDAGDDDAGQPLQTWTTLVTVWAHVLGATGMGYIKAGVGGVEVNAYSFRIRYRTDLDAADRVVFNGQNFDVKSVRHDLAGKGWTDLVCEVSDANGG